MCKVRRQAAVAEVEFSMVVATMNLLTPDQNSSRIETLPAQLFILDAKHDRPVRLV